MTEREFDDAPQWYWAVASMLTNPTEKFERADNRFVVAAGQRNLWARVRAEIDRGEHCAWDKFGPKDGKATLADCLTVWLTAREQYGANYNRMVLELGQVPNFATYIFESTKSRDLCNMVSSPLSEAPLLREAYDEKVEDALGHRVEATLNLDNDEWRH